MGFFDNKKLMFSFLAAVMYLVIASPAVYNIVGSVLGLENYDDHESNDRTVLSCACPVKYPSKRGTKSFSNTPRGAAIL